MQKKYVGITLFFCFQRFFHLIITNQILAMLYPIALTMGASFAVHDNQKRAE